MDDNGILKEFVVKLSWVHDEVNQKKVFNFVEGLEKNLTKLSVTATTAALGVVAGLEKMAKSFDAAYYQSSRTGSSVKELNAFKFAASQMGSSAEEAGAAVEGLARRLRENPGYAGWLKSLGASDPRNVVRSLNEIAPKLAAMPLYQAESYAKQFDIPENLLLALRQVAEFRRLEREGASKYGILGFDPEKAAEDGRKLSNAFKGLYDTLNKIGELAMSAGFAKLEPTIKKLNDYLLDHGREIANIVSDIINGILKLIDAVVEFLPTADKFAKKMGGWDVVLTGLAVLLTTRLIPGLGSLRAALAALISLSPPGWLLRILGLSVMTDMAVPNEKKPGIINQWDDNAHGPAANPSDITSGPYRFRDFVPKGWFGGYGTGRAYARGGGGNDAIRRRGHQQYIDRTNYTGSNANVLRQAAAQLGTTPQDLATVISYETRGSFSPHIHGGFSKRYGAGAYHGLIQFGPPERATYGASDKQSFAEQMPAVVSYLKSRGFKPGMGLLDLYSTINAGRPGLYGARDVNGTVAEHVDRMKKEHTANARRFLGSADISKFKMPPATIQPFGNLDASRAIFNHMPLGANSASTTTVNMHQTNNNHVTGVSDPTAAAAQIGAKANKHSSMLLKNLQSAIG